MQHPPSAIAEMERAMSDLGLKGVIISDHVAGRTYDEPDFLPFFRSAQELGAIVFFHQGGDTVVNHRIRRYKLGNAVGNLTERALVYATLVFGGVMDRCPGLEPYLAHGGGYTSFGVARMDKVPELSRTPRSRVSSLLSGRMTVSPRLSHPVTT
jgi:aminocarboxymuconate-semialdehyde decarboxylase